MNCVHFDLNSFLTDYGHPSDFQQFNLSNPSSLTWRERSLIGCELNILLIELCSIFFCLFHENFAFLYVEFNIIFIGSDQLGVHLIRTVVQKC